MEDINMLKKLLILQLINSCLFLFFFLKQKVKAGKDHKVTFVKKCYSQHTCIKPQQLANRQPVGLNVHTCVCTNAK